MDRTPRTATLRYRVAMPDPRTHLYHVTLTIPRPDADQHVSLPAWIPGSYLIREFARHLQDLQARQGGQACTVTATGKAGWQVGCVPGRPLTLSWQVHALDPSVRAAWLDSRRAFFNGTSLCLRVHGQENQPHELQVVPPPGARDWSLATALTAVRTDARGFGTYRAGDYDELVDSPVEMGAFWSGEFTVAGVPHRFVVAGAPPVFDGERLLADTRAICETAIRFWHGRGRPPHDRYLFLLHAVHEGYGGLEHRHSTALVCGRADLPRQGEPDAGEGYTTLLGLISHEYFHTWNVKRLRPAEFARYDYDRENHTRLLWFFEGFTSYYDDLLLRRAGRLDDARYLRLLGKTIEQVLQTPGRAVQSVAQASFDAWLKYYRPDENTPNATVSYYTKGALVALCLDLTLRAEGRGDLDAVMRGLWARCQAGPMTEDDLLAELQAAGGRDYAPELAEWVHGTGELPLRALLLRHGVRVTEERGSMAQRLGLRVAEGAGGIHVKGVLRGSAAEQAGFAAGDEWLGVSVNGAGWRLHRLDELALCAGSGQALTALVSRDRQLLHLPLTLPPPSANWRLEVADAAAVAAWLAPPSRPRH